MNYADCPTKPVRDYLDSNAGQSSHVACAYSTNGNRQIALLTQVQIPHLSTVWLKVSSHTSSRWTMKGGDLRIN
jgi:hypothetical protein